MEKTDIEQLIADLDALLGGEAVLADSVDEDAVAVGVDGDAELHRLAAGTLVDAHLTRFPDQK